MATGILSTQFSLRGLAVKDESRLRHWTNRISYMRWSQARMQLAMASLLSRTGETHALSQSIQTAAPVEV